MSSRFHHIGLSVSDLDAAIAFYHDVLGFETITEIRFDDQRYADIMRLPDAAGRAAMLRQGDTQIELFQFEHPRPNTAGAVRPVSDLGISHFCLEVTDVEHEYRRLSDLGVEFHCPPIDFGGVAKATYARDPDGNVFELWQRLP